MKEYLSKTDLIPGDDGWMQDLHRCYHFLLKNESFLIVHNCLLVQLVVFKFWCVTSPRGPVNTHLWCLMMILYIFDIIIQSACIVYFSSCRLVASVKYIRTTQCYNDYQLGPFGHNTLVILHVYYHELLSSPCIWLVSDYV